MTSDEDDDDPEQSEAWETLYERIAEVLGRFGVDDYRGREDYLLVDDNYGWRRHKVELQRLHILRPEIVAELQGLLDDYPDWEVVMAVDVPGKEEEWPLMGVTIRKHEIIDGLRREFLPEPYRTYSYPGSRPGTGYD